MPIRPQNNITQEIIKAKTALTKAFADLPSAPLSEKAAETLYEALQACNQTGASDMAAMRAVVNALLPHNRDVASEYSYQTLEGLTSALFLLNEMGKNERFSHVGNSVKVQVGEMLQSMFDNANSVVVEKKQKSAIIQETPANPLPDSLNAMLGGQLSKDDFREIFQNDKYVQSMLYAIYLGVCTLNTQQRNQAPVKFVDFCSLVQGEEVKVQGVKRVLPEAFTNILEQGTNVTRAVDLIERGRKEALFKSASIKGTQYLNVLDSESSASVQEALSDLSEENKTLLKNVVALAIPPHTQTRYPRIPPERKALFQEMESLLHDAHTAHQVTKETVYAMRSLIQDPMAYLLDVMPSKDGVTSISNALCADIFKSKPNFVETMSTHLGLPTSKALWEEALKRPDISESYHKAGISYKSGFRQKHTDHYDLADWLQQPEHAAQFKTYLRGEAEIGNPFLDALGVPPHTLECTTETPQPQVKGEGAEVTSPQKQGRQQGG
jgi:hypothetical protein